MAILLLLAEARLAALVWVLWLPLVLRLPPGAAETVALATGPVVG